MISTLSYVLNLDSRRFISALNSADFALRVFETSVGRSNPLLKNFSVLMTGAGMSFAAAKIIEVGDAYTNMQRRLSILTNSMNAMGGPTVKQGQMFEFLQTTANEAGVSIEAITQAFDRMLPMSIANGISLETLQNVFKGTVGALTLTGASTVEINRAFLALSQIVGKNQLQMEELRGQLGEALPVSMLIVAQGMTQLYREMGKLDDQTVVTTQHLNRMITNAEIDGKTFMLAWERGTRAFVPLMASRMTLMQSQMTVFANNLFSIFGRFQQQTGIQTMLSSMMDTLNKGMVSFAKSFSDADLERIGDSIRTYLYDTINETAHILDRMMPVLTVAWESLKMLAYDVKAGWDSLPDELKGFGIIGALFFGIQGIRVFTAGMMALGALKREFPETFKAIGDVVGKLYHTIEEAMRNAMVPDSEAVTAAKIQIISLRTELEQLEAKRYSKSASVVSPDGTASSERDARIAEIKTLDEEIAAKTTAYENAIRDLQRIRGDTGAAIRQYEMDTAIGPEADKLRAELQDLDSQLAGKRKQLASLKTDLDALSKGNQQKQTFRNYVLNEQEIKSTRALIENEVKLVEDEIDGLVDNVENAKNSLIDIGRDASSPIIQGARELTNTFQMTFEDFQKMNLEAMQAQIDIQKMTAEQVNMSEQQIAQVQQWVDTTMMSGDATGEVRGQVKQALAEVMKLQQVLTSIHTPAIDNLIRERADKHAEILATEGEEGLKKYQAATAQMVLDMQKSIFETQWQVSFDSFAAELAKKWAAILGAMSGGAKTDAGIQSELDARQAAISDFLAKLGWSEEKINDSLNGLYKSAGEESNKLHERMRSDNVRNAKKATEDAELEYQAQSNAVDAYIEKLTQASVFTAKLAEEKAAGFGIGPYQVADQGEAAVAEADAKGRIRDINQELIRQQFEMLAMRNPEIAALQIKDELAKSAVEYEKQKAKIASLQDPASRQAFLDKEMQSLEMRRANMSLERELFKNPAYSQEWLQLEIDASAMRIEAAQRELEVLNNPNMQAIADLQHQADLLREMSGAGQQMKDNTGENSETNDLMRQNDLIQEKLNLTRIYYEYTMPWQQRLLGLTNNMVETFTDGLAGGIADVITGVTTLGEAVQNLGKELIGMVIKFFAEWAIQWLISQAMQMLGIATIGAATNAAASAAAFAWAPAATLATIASWGGAAVAAPPAVMTAVGTTTGAIAALQAPKNLGGFGGPFHDGGFTDKETLALVEKGELIVPRKHAKDAASILGAVGMRFSGVYHNGGFVDSPVDDAMIDSMSGRRVEIVNYFNMDDVSRHMERNPSAILNVMSKNNRNKMRPAR